MCLACTRMKVVTSVPVTDILLGTQPTGTSNQQDPTSTNTATHNADLILYTVLVIMQSNPLLSMDIGNPTAVRNSGPLNPLLGQMVPPIITDLPGLCTRLYHSNRLPATPCFPLTPLTPTPLGCRIMSCYLPHQQLVYLGQVAPLATWPH